MPLRLDRSDAGFLLAAALTIAAFLFGGSARDDVISLLFLRPLSVLAFVAALLVLPREIWRNNRGAIALAFSLPLLILVQLVPLPPAIWSSLPGRELAWEVGAAAGIEQPWRPISLVPYRTWNSFWALFTPLAAFLLALGLDGRMTRRLVFVFAAAVAVSAAFSVFQVIGAPGNAFYLYSITNEESGVGLFANRNHQAILLVIGYPVLAALASFQKRPAWMSQWLVIGLGILIIPFLLVTGSRAGLALGVVGLGLAWFAYRASQPARRPDERRKIPYALIGGAVGAAAMIFVALASDKIPALERMLARDAGPDLRMQVWGPTLEASWTYFPFGSGFGTFVEVYQVIEPDTYLAPWYWNHAHNDWLELLLSGGAAAAAIVLAALLLFSRRAFALLRLPRGRQETAVVTARLGLAIILVLAMGSVYEYPLRTPSLALLFGVASAWLARRP